MDNKENPENVVNIEELPEVNLDQEDRLRIIKELLLIFVFSSVGK
jgi:hypothetical protein